MAISASSIASSSTLNELRTQFNNLVTDVAAIEGGSISYTTLNTTTTNATTLNVKEDGTIVFEGATDDGFETTLTVVDPTADRTVTFPNASGTVIVSDSSTNVTTLPDDLLIKDGGTIGNASVADVLTLASTGIVTFKDDIIIKDGGTIGSASDTDAITIAANGNITVNQNLSIGGDLDVTGTLDLSDSNFTNVGSIQLDSIAGDGDTNTSITFSGSDVITIATGGSTAATFNASQVTTLSGNLIIPDAGNIGSASDTDAIAISSGGVVTVSATTANTSASDGALVVGGGVGVGADLTVGDDLRLITDSAVLSFGADSDTTLTHTDGSGLTINSTNKIMFRDSALSVSSSADGQLDIDADTEVEITATTVDINGAVEISGTTTQTGVSTSAAKDVFNAGLSVKNGSSSAGFIEFFEDSDNGTNKVTLVGPASTGDVTLTLPAVTDTVAAVGDITALAIALG